MLCIDVDLESSIYQSQIHLSCSHCARIKRSDFCEVVHSLLLLDFFLYAKYFLLHLQGKYCVSATTKMTIVYVN